jgi:hypothetical protein
MADACRVMGGRRSRGWATRWWVLVAAVAFLVGGGSLAHASTTVITPEYRFDAFRWEDSAVRVVTFVAGGNVVVKKVMSYPTFRGQRTTSDMGIRSGALATTNGDFRWLKTKAPKHLSVIDGEIMTTGSQPGIVLRTDTAGTRADIGPPIFEVLVTQGDVSFPLSGWNAQQPGEAPPRYLEPGHPVAWTIRGGEDRFPQVAGCSAMLRPLVDPRGNRRVYEVVRVRTDCSSAPLQPPRDDVDTVVLHGRQVRHLVPGRLQMRVQLGLGGTATQVIGGVPRVVKDGHNVGPLCPFRPCPKTGTGPDNPLYKVNPRTAIGIGGGCKDVDLATPCRYWMVTVDGRQERSRGVRFPKLGDLFLELGASDALNLDGGGSTTMWLRKRNEACAFRREIGCVVNRPVYGERIILDAVGLMPLGV